MDKDPLKEFVQRNRKEFDDLELPPLVFERLRKEMLPAVKTDEKIRELPLLYWASAAILAVVIFAALIFFTLKIDNARLAQSPSHNRFNEHHAQQEHKDNTGSKKNAIQAKNNTISLKTETKKVSKQPAGTKFKSAINDSSSIVSRLSAVLNTGNSGALSRNEISALCKILDHDENSNLRLAAFDKLSRSLTLQRLKQIAAKSLLRQQNPMVQFEMISILAAGNEENPNIVSIAQAIAAAPETEDAVRDQALMILMKQNIL